MENNRMNLEFIQKLADLVVDKNLGEITVQNGDSTITIKGKKVAAQTSYSHHIHLILNVYLIYYNK